MIEEKKSQNLLIIISVLLFFTLSYMAFFQRDWMDDVIFGEREVSNIVDDEIPYEEEIVSEEIPERGIDFSFNPEEGNISSDSLKVDILVDVKSFEPSGFEIELEFLGGAEYKSFENGNIEGCEVSEVEKEDSIYFFCLLEEIKSFQTGVFATLIFENIEGEDEFTISVREAKAEDIPVNYSDITYIIE